MPVRQVPLFPLPKCVLFPSALLPLHVFEARYRIMMDLIADELPDSRFLAVVLLAEGFEDTYHTLHAPIHDILTIGRVVEHVHLADGRYNLLLRGEHRGRVISEDHSFSFRMAKVEIITPDPAAGQLGPQQVPALNAILSQAIRSGVTNLEVVNAIIEGSDSGEELVDLLAFNLLPGDHTTAKQRMLSELNVEARCHLLIKSLRDLTQALD